MEKNIISLLRYDPRSFANLIILSSALKHNKFFKADELSEAVTLTIVSMCGLLKHPVIDEPIILGMVPYIKTIRDSLSHFGDKEINRTLRQYDNVPDKVVEYNKSGELSRLGFDVPITTLTSEQYSTFYTILKVHDQIGPRQIHYLLTSDDSIFAKARRDNLVAIDGDYIVSNSRNM